MVSLGGSYFHMGCFFRGALWRNNKMHWCHSVDMWFDQVAQLLSCSAADQFNWIFKFWSTCLSISNLFLNLL